MRKLRRRHPRVVLDTNVWRDLADADAGEMLRRTARSARVVVQIPPAVVYEALRTPNADTRAKQIELMSRCLQVLGRTTSDDPELPRLWPPS